MKDKEKLKVNNLIALRQLLTNTLTVLIGGTVGLLFINASPLKYVFIFIGLFYVYVFTANLSSTISELNLLLNKEEEKC